MKVCLDAGHYGLYNRSPVNKNYYESLFTWKFHLLLKAELEKYHIDVVTTREDQTKDLPVYDRGLKAKGANLFISIHSNAIGNGTVTPAEEKVDRVSVFYPFDDTGKCRDFADRIGKVVADTMGVKQGNKVATRESKEYPGSEYYGVMRGARKAGCKNYFILEHSFHTNRAATDFLLNDANLQIMAENEAMLIAEFIGAYKLGDVSGDGNVDAFDYMLLKAAILGKAKLNVYQAKNADMNRDGQLNAFDYLLLKNKILRG